MGFCYLRGNGIAKFTRRYGGELAFNRFNDFLFLHVNFLHGNGDPEVRYLTSGEAVATQHDALERTQLYERWFVNGGNSPTYIDV